ncbi:hypothetical protein WCLP8_1140005 [uncultured Gammaproteobacteria bacterium]
MAAIAMATFSKNFPERNDKDAHRRERLGSDWNPGYLHLKCSEARLGPTFSRDETRQAAGMDARLVLSRARSTKEVVLTSLRLRCVG